MLDRGVAFLLESLLRGAAAPMFGALSDRLGRRALLLAAALITAAVLPCFLLVSGPASLFAWSTAMGIAGAANMPVATALLLDLAPPERRQAVLAVNYTGMSVAYTLGVMPAGYVAEQGYGLLAIISAIGYLLVAILYALAVRGTLPLERSRGDTRLVTDLLSVARDRAFIGFAALAFIFPFAMGQVVTASATENPDLFWGLRGGGGNFGVVSSFEYQLHPVGPEVLAGGVLHSFRDAPEVFRFFAEFVAQAPDDLSVTASTSTMVNLWSSVRRIDMSCTKSPGLSGPRHSLACS